MGGVSVDRVPSRKGKNEIGMHSNLKTIKKYYIIKHIYSCILKIANLSSSSSPTPAPHPCGEGKGKMIGGDTFNIKLFAVPKVSSLLHLK